MCNEEARVFKTITSFEVAYSNEYVTLALPNYLHCNYCNNSYNLKVMPLRAKNVPYFISKNKKNPCNNNSVIVHCYFDFLNSACPIFKLYIIFLCYDKIIFTN